MFPAPVHRVGNLRLSPPGNASSLRSGSSSSPINTRTGGEIFDGVRLADVLDPGALERDLITAHLQHRDVPAGDEYDCGQEGETDDD